MSAVYGVMYGMSIEQLERVGSSVEIKASDIICRLMDCFGRFVLMVRCEVRDVTSNGSVPTPWLRTAAVHSWFFKWCEIWGEPLFRSVPSILDLVF